MFTRQLCEKDIILQMRKLRQGLLTGPGSQAEEMVEPLLDSGLPDSRANVTKYIFKVQNPFFSASSTIADACIAFQITGVAMP